MKKILLLSFSVLTLFSCSQETMMEQNEAPEMRLIPQKESYLIDKIVINLNADDAQNVALRFASNGTDTRGVTQSNPTVETIYDHSLGIPNDGWLRANSYNPNSIEPDRLNFLKDQKIITVKK